MKNDLKENTDFYKTSKSDIVLIITILFFSVTSLLWINHSSGMQSSAPRKALLYQRERLLEKIDLEKDRIITLPKIKMEIEVKSGRIRIVKADCPQQLCVNMGWIKHHGQTIACVPNKVLIKIDSVHSPLTDVVCY